MAYRNNDIGISLATEFFLINPVYGFISIFYILIGPSFINIYNDIISNFTSSINILSNEMEKNNACIMEMI